MMIYSVKDKSTIAPLFAGWAEACVWSCLQDCQGKAYVSNLTNPKGAKIVLGDFCCFAGEVDEDLVHHIPAEHTSGFMVMIPQNEQWAKLIEKVWQDKANGRMRYATKKNPELFDEAKLQEIVNGLSDEYAIKMIDRELYEQTIASDWAGDLCGNYSCYEEYQEKGLGVAIIKGQEVVAGASSFAYYHGGIEIEIDTRADQRRKGLASVSGAKLILECLQRDLYPNWDAHSEISLKTAEKLGYELEEEYLAYDVTTI